MIVHHRRCPECDDGVFSFKTPDAWLNAPGIRTRYEGLIFHRNPRDNDEAKRIVGVGHQLFDQALAQAGEWEGALALSRELEHPLAIFRFLDALTSQSGQVRQVIAGVTVGDADDLMLIRDEAVLELLNRRKPGQQASETGGAGQEIEVVARWLERARAYAQANLDTLQLPFRRSIVTDLVLLWPATVIRT